MWVTNHGPARTAPHINIPDAVKIALQSAPGAWSHSGLSSENSMQAPTMAKDVAIAVTPAIAAAGEDRGHRRLSCKVTSTPNTPINAHTTQTDAINPHPTTKRRHPRDSAMPWFAVTA